MEYSVQSQFDANGLVQILGAWMDREGPLYQRLADALRSAIMRRDLVVGQLLPPERLLATHLAVSRSTVVAGYELLREEGLLERRQGSGTRVRSTPTQPVRSGVTTSFQRNTLFRHITDGTGSTIDLTGAYLIDPEGLQPFLSLADLPPDLADLTETSGYSPLGYRPLREVVAKHLSDRGLPTHAEQVLVTTGSQQAIYLTGWLYLQRGDTAVVENPTYPGALDAFTSFGARLTGVRTRRQGVDIDALSECLARQTQRLAYLIPTHHNPVGGVLPDHARRQVASLSEKFQVPFIEDESLAGLGIDGPPPPPLAAFSPGAPIITIGSLSKLFWGGLRVGWIRANEQTVSQLARLRAVADLGGSLPAQLIAARVLARYTELSLARSRVLAERLEMTSALLQRLLPGWSWEQPQGGLCLWVRLPYGNASEFAQVALRNGVAIVAGPVSSFDGSFGDYLRLPFGNRPDVVAEGISRLARAWQAYAPVGEGSSRDLAVIV